MADPQQEDTMDEKHKTGHIFNQLNKDLLSDRGGEQELVSLCL